MSTITTIKLLQPKLLFPIAYFICVFYSVYININYQNTKRGSVNLSWKCECFYFFFFFLLFINSCLWIRILYNYYIWDTTLMCIQQNQWFSIHIGNNNMHLMNKYSFISIIHYDLVTKKNNCISFPIELTVLFPWWTNSTLLVHHIPNHIWIIFDYINYFYSTCISIYSINVWYLKNILWDGN